MDATLPLFDDYKVDLEAFEGPLDLLLHLIRKDEVDIYDIPIGRITEQYMQWLTAMHALDINVAGEFIVMAATLMSIKSRMLLPVEEQPDEDADPEDALDPRMDLVRQLIEYKKFKDAAETFSLRELTRADTFSPHAMLPLLLPTDATDRKLGDIGLDELLAAFRRVLERAPSVTFGNLKAQRWSVPDKMQHVLQRIQLGGHQPFETFFPPSAPKGEVIVTFIAMLELLRLRHITIIQEDIFSPLYISPIPADTPDAHLPIPSFDEIDIY